VAFSQLLEKGWTWRKSGTFLCCPSTLMSKFDKWSLFTALMGRLDLVEGK